MFGAEAAACSRFTTVDHIGNSQEKGLYRDAPKSITHSQLRVPPVGCCYREHRTTEGRRCPQKHRTSGCLTQPGPVGELVDPPSDACARNRNDQRTDAENHDAL